MPDQPADPLDSPWPRPPSTALVPLRRTVAVPAPSRAPTHWSRRLPALLTSRAGVVSTSAAATVASGVALRLLRRAVVRALSARSAGPEGGEVASYAVHSVQVVRVVVETISRSATE